MLTLESAFSRPLLGIEGEWAAWCDGGQLVARCGEVQLTLPQPPALGAARYTQVCVQGHAEGAHVLALAGGVAYTWRLSCSGQPSASPAVRLGTDVLSAVLVRGAPTTRSFVVLLREAAVHLLVEEEEGGGFTPAAALHGLTALVAHPKPRAFTAALVPAGASTVLLLALAYGAHVHVHAMLVVEGGGASARSSVLRLRASTSRPAVGDVRCLALGHDGEGEGRALVLASVDAPLLLSGPSQAPSTLNSVREGLREWGASKGGGGGGMMAALLGAPAPAPTARVRFVHEGEEEGGFEVHTHHVSTYSGVGVGGMRVPEAGSVLARLMAVGGGGGGPAHAPPSARACPSLQAFCLGSMGALCEPGDGEALTALRPPHPAMSLSGLPAVALADQLALVATPSGFLLAVSSSARGCAGTVLVAPLDTSSLRVAQPVAYTLQAEKGVGSCTLDAVLGLTWSGRELIAVAGEPAGPPPDPTGAEAAPAPIFARTHAMPRVYTVTACVPITVAAEVAAAARDRAEVGTPLATLQALLDGAGGGSAQSVSSAASPPAPSPARARPFVPVRPLASSSSPRSPLLQGRGAPLSPAQGPHALQPRQLPPYSPRERISSVDSLQGAGGRPCVSPMAAGPHAAQRLAMQAEAAAAHASAAAAASRALDLAAEALDAAEGGDSSVMAAALKAAGAARTAAALASSPSSRLESRA